MHKLISIMIIFLTLTILPCSTKAVGLTQKLSEGDNSTELFKKDADAIEVFSQAKDADAIQVFSQANQNLTINKNDIYLMAQIVYAESCAEPFEGKLGVASVILNRLKYKSFPKSIVGVINQKNAFSCVLTGKENVVPDSASYEAVIEALNGNDPTNDATFFYNPRISTSTWMNNIDKNNVITIGHHVFFKVNN